MVLLVLILHLSQQQGNNSQQSGQHSFSFLFESFNINIMDTHNNENEEDQQHVVNEEAKLEEINCVSPAGTSTSTSSSTSNSNNHFMESSSSLCDKDDDCKNEEKEDEVTTRNNSDCSYANEQNELLVHIVQNEIPVINNEDEEEEKLEEGTIRINTHTDSNDDDSDNNNLTHHPNNESIQLTHDNDELLNDFLQGGNGISLPHNDQQSTSSIGSGRSINYTHVETRNNNNNNDNNNIQNDRHNERSTEYTDSILSRTAINHISTTTTTSAFMIDDININVMRTTRRIFLCSMKIYALLIGVVILAIIVSWISFTSAYVVSIHDVSTKLLKFIFLWDGLLVSLTQPFTPFCVFLYEHNIIGM